MSPEERKVTMDELLSAGEDALGRAEHQLASKPGRREVTKISTVVAIVVSVLMGGVAITVSTLANSQAATTAAAQQAGEKQAAADRKLAQDAYQAAQDANQALKNRGQAPVSLPDPGSADPTDTLVAAAAARVLAQLPDLRPSAAALGQAIAEYFISNPITPVGPTPGQISRAVAEYLEANPPAPGEDGAPGQSGTNGKDGANGKDGQPPTDAQIQQAFVAYVQANPEFLPGQLCKNYGQNFNKAKDLTSSDGTRYTLYGCITEVQPPVHTTTPTTPTPTFGG